MIWHTIFAKVMVLKSEPFVIHICFNNDCNVKYADIFENTKLRSILDDVPLDNLYEKIGRCRIYFKTT